MPLGYNNTPLEGGAAERLYTGSAGYINFSQQLPFYTGKSRIQSIPEYMRSPYLLGDDLVQTIQEGGAHLAKLLFQYAASSRITRPDVKFRWKVEQSPISRFYLKAGTYTTSAAGYTKLLLVDYTGPTGKQINPENKTVVGDIARVQVGDYLLLMFSRIAPDREGAVAYTEEGAAPSGDKPFPEIAKVTAVNYDTKEITVYRNWAGARRTTRTNTAGNNFIVGAGTGEVKPADAFFIQLHNSMKEDEIDAKTWSLTYGWDEGNMQRSLLAWGAGHFGELINSNLGYGSQYAKSQKLAVEEFYRRFEWTALFGEKSEGFDSATGDWYGTTDGLLVKIPKGHYLKIVPPDYTETTVSNFPMGSFDPIFFNKLLEPMVYYGAKRKTAIVGANFHTAFVSMFQKLTTAVSDLKSEWGFYGNTFYSSNGLVLDVVPSDMMTLNGLSNTAIIYDPSAFRMVNLQGYPIDMVDITNENPLKMNGFIHGVYGFLDMNPDAHWVLNLDPTLRTGLTDHKDRLFGQVIS